MDGFYRGGMLRDEWVMSNPTVIEYNHRNTSAQEMQVNQPPAPVQPPDFSNNFENLVQLQMKMLNNIQQHSSLNTIDSSQPKQLTSYGPPKKGPDDHISEKYNPFIEDINDEDMDISDEEKESQHIGGQSKATKGPDRSLREFAAPITPSTEVKSGAAFYQGLILYIPPFEQLANSYRGSPALKMLYASFEFSFKMAVKIETKSRENDPNVRDATVFFRDNIISIGSGRMPHIEASIRALELLSETCYTIQAKEDYFTKCKLVDAENMKTLNLKKWEAVSEKYPKIIEVTKESHIQKTFAVFLDNHTSTGLYEDIVCCNLTRQEVQNIKGVVEFFQLTMLPCSISTNLSKKNTPCVVSIHKYTSAKKLLDILVECGGENDKFKLHPPDTFRDFYKLHPDCWDPSFKKLGDKIEEAKTTLEDPELQTLIMKPYENIISELFEKHKLLPKIEKPSNDSLLRKAGDDFMKNTFQIDMTQNKNVAPVERMQLLLKYMEQLQEYGSRVLTSGRAEMIRIYHNAIDNVRKDLEDCRKDIEKEQKEKTVIKTKETSSSSSTSKKRSPISKRKTPPRRRSKSPPSKSRHGNSRNRSVSPRRRARSKSPRRNNRPRRSSSPRRTARSPPRRVRSKSPRRPRSKSPRRLHRGSPPRRVRSPLRLSPTRRLKSPGPRFPKEDDAFISIFKDQFRRYVDNLRRFRIEIEDTPIDQRSFLRDRLISLRVQLGNFKQKVRVNPELGDFEMEVEICTDELKEQEELISGKPGPNDLAPTMSPPSYINVRGFDHNRVLPPTTYPLPGVESQQQFRGAGVIPPTGVYGQERGNYWSPF